MGRVVDRALNPQANVYLLDLDDVEEVGQYADQIAGLINMLIREQEDLHQALYEERGSVKGWNHQDVLHWVGKGNGLSWQLLTTRLWALPRCRKRTTMSA
jgi:hypothetical protein